MNSLFGLRPIVACTAGFLGLASAVFLSFTLPQAILVGLAYVVLRGAYAKEW